MVTEKPLACRSLANDAEIIPFPKEEVTPPVTKMNFEATSLLLVLWTAKLGFIFEMPAFTFGGARNTVSVNSNLSGSD